MFEKFVKDFKYGDELVKLGFDEFMYATEDNCKYWYEHCKENNMIFNKGSYGNIVHKNFHNIFKLTKDYDEENGGMLYVEWYDELLGMKNNFINHPELDHLESYCDIDDPEHLVFFTCSPYNFNVDYFNWLSSRYIDISIINPFILDYIGFIPRNYRYIHPLNTCNYLISSSNHTEIIADTMRRKLKIEVPLVSIVSDYFKKD